MGGRFNRIVGELRTAALIDYQSTGIVLTVPVLAVTLAALAGWLTLIR